MSRFMELAMTGRNTGWLITPLEEAASDAGISVVISHDNDHIIFQYSEDTSNELAEALTYELLTATEIDQASATDLTSETASVKVKLLWIAPGDELAARPMESEDDETFDDEGDEEDDTEVESDEEEIPLEESKKKKENDGSLGILTTPDSQKLVGRLHNMSCGDDMKHYPSFWQEIDAVCRKYRDKSGYKPSMDIDSETASLDLELAEVNTEVANRIREEISKSRKSKRGWKDGYGGFLSTFMKVCAGRREKIDKYWTALDGENLTEEMIKLGEAVIDAVEAEREKRGMDMAEDSKGIDGSSTTEESAGSLYYVLFEFMPDTKKWEQVFGDYDKSVVRDELQDRRDHDVKLKNLKILPMKDHSNEALMQALKELNA